MKPALARSPALLEFSELVFENRFIAALPGDPETRNVSRQVANAAYTRVAPTPVAAPKVLAWSSDMGAVLGLAPPPATGLAAEVLGGNRVLEGMQPYAARYGGHQFGNWAGQLGDGRAITLAETRAVDGTRLELQLKGAGRTPYSRGADGRAVLRSSLREFLCSEAMHALGVPTTRALSLVGTGDAVVRDMFYDGHPEAEPGAVVCRVAPSFVRFGNVQIHAAQREPETQKTLLDYVLREHYASLNGDRVAWYHELCRRTARLMVDWMRLGFVHGVMNTDNMSILGLTIDYGPYGWLEGYDPMWTPNTTDAQGRRYCYGNQPGIAQWNLARLAESLLGTMERAPLEDGLGLFGEVYEQGSNAAFAAKLGLMKLDGEADGALLAGLFETMALSETDFTIFFRNLAQVPLDPAATDAALIEPLHGAYYDETALDGPPREKLLAWLNAYRARARSENVESEARRTRMNAVNPLYVPRIWLAQQAIDSMTNDDASVLERLMRVLQNPYTLQPDCDDLAARRPEWARNRAGCSALSCSS
ncbi:MAG: YdiU family protein [Proteobacteria bacterium]|nr:YdiU family protein [Pseudomonadota bacterium]